MTSTAIEKDEQTPAAPLSVSPVSQWEDRFTFVVFLCLGTAALLAWNCLLNTLPSIRAIIFPDQGSFTDTATATYFTVVCALTLTFTAFPITRAEILLTALGGIALACVALPLIYTFVPAATASLAFHLYCAVLGICVAMTVSGSIAIASSLPKLYVTGVASGMGLAGILSFGLWMVMSHGLFNGKDLARVLTATWILFGFAAAFAIGTMVLLVVFAHRPWVTDLFVADQLLDPDVSRSRGLFTRVRSFARLRYTARNDDDVEAEKKDAKPPTPLQLSAILRTVAGNVTLRFFIFFQTLLVFPAIGPLAWNDSLLIADISVVRRALWDMMREY